MTPYFADEEEEGRRVVGILLLVVGKEGLDFVGANVVGREVRVGSGVRSMDEGLNVLGFIVDGDSVGTLVFKLGVG